MEPDYYDTKVETRLNLIRTGKTIEPLHLLAAIVEERDSKLAQLLRDHGVTRGR
jgi:hypothetical protein